MLTSSSVLQDMATGRPPPLPPEKHQRAVTDSEILDIAAETACDWLKIAHRLPYANHPGKLAFKLKDPKLNELSKACPDDEERMVQLLYMWRAMSPMHTWGPLRIALYKSGYGTIAEQVLQVSLDMEGECHTNTHTHTHTHRHRDTHTHTNACVHAWTSVHALTCTQDAQP